jgi:hypothetical protein
MEREIVKIITSSDGDRRVRICRRDDGLYDFHEDKRYRRDDGEPYWAPMWSPAYRCDTLQTADREARTRVDWLIGT